jgi:hypothetical protein
MGFNGFSLVISLVLAASASKRPLSLGEALVAGQFQQAIVDLSMQLHRNTLTREAAIAVLLAFVNPSLVTLAAAMRLALFSSSGAVGRLIEHLRHAEGRVPTILFVSERGSNR